MEIDWAGRGVPRHVDGGAVLAARVVARAGLAALVRDRGRVVLERVLQAACWAPTGGNQQPWRVVVATEPATKQALADIYAPEWAKYVAGFMKMLEGLPAEKLAPWERVAAAGDHLAAHLQEAPAILVFCANPAMMAITDAKLDRVSVVGGGSIYPAVQNAMLACVAEGLGCTLTTLHDRC